MAYRILLICFSMVIMVHCGKPHHGKTSKASVSATMAMLDDGKRNAA